MTTPGQTPSIIHGRPVGMDTIGTASTASGVTTYEYGTGALRQTVIRLTAYALAMTETATTSWNGSFTCYTMPVGAIGGLVGTAVLTSYVSTGSGLITATNAAAPIFSIGTVASAGATLTTTEANIGASTTSNVTVAGSSTGTAYINAATTPYNSTNDPSGTPGLPVLFNCALADSTNASATGTLTLTGYIILTWFRTGAPLTLPPL